MQALPRERKELFETVTANCNMAVLQEAANLVYHPASIPAGERLQRANVLTDTHGIFSLYGDGVEATSLDAAVVDSDGSAFQGNRYMKAACSLVVENGLVTRYFMLALVSERIQFCRNRISHIKASLEDSGMDLTVASFAEIAEANERLASDTFGSKMYKPRHDLATRKI